MLERLVEALERIATALERQKPGGKMETTSAAITVTIPPVVEAVAEPVQPTPDLKAYAVQVCQKLGAAKTPAFTNEVRRVLSGYGFSKLSDVTADKAAAVYKEIEQWVAKQK